MADQNETVLLENVNIIYRNFEGRPGPYNQAGNRNFGVMLTDEMADGLRRSGYNVKTTKERELDEGEMTGNEPWLPVFLKYGFKPPRVVLISSRGRTELGEGEVELVDNADIVSVDLIIRPYDWHLQTGASGRKAMLKSIYVTINEDELELKYADIKPVGKHTTNASSEE